MLKNNSYKRNSRSASYTTRDGDVAQFQPPSLELALRPNVFMVLKHCNYAIYY